MAPTGRADTVSLLGNVRAAWSGASDGDLRPTGHGPSDGAALVGFAVRAARPSGATFGEVAWVTQVHGSHVATVDGPRPDHESDGVGVRNLGAGDALVAASPDRAVCVLTADCAPVALASPEGVFAAVHAGWRGLVDGVIEAAVVTMRTSGATEIAGVLGPCIHACCYEFGDAELDLVARRYGPSVRARTSSGGPALDLVAGVQRALHSCDARLLDVVDACTACGSGEFSHRARRDAGRQALVVWSVPG